MADLVLDTQTLEALERIANALTRLTVQVERLAESASDLDRIADACDIGALLAAQQLLRHTPGDTSWTTQARSTQVALERLVAMATRRVNRWFGGES